MVNVHGTIQSRFSHSYTDEVIDAKLVHRTVVVCTLTFTELIERCEHEMWPGHKWIGMLDWIVRIV